MPFEWQQLTVEQIAAPTAAALATGPFGSSIGSKHFVNFGVPVIRGSNLSADISSRLSDDGLVFVSKEKAQEFQRSVARRGDLVFTCWGTINQVGLIDGTAKFDEYIVSNKQMKLTVDPKKADPRFIYYVFSSPQKQQEILENGIGSSVPGFNLGQLRAHRLSLPPLSEQRAIAGCLKLFDDRIDLLRQTNATLESIAQALFKSWFIDFDPVRAKAEGREPEGMDATTAALFPAEFEESTLGLIPKGWQAGTLTDAFEVNPSRKLTKGENAKYFEMANTPISGHRPVERVGPRAFGSGCKFKNDDALLAKITPCLENGKSAFVDFLEDEEVGWGSTEFIVLRSKPVLPKYGAYLMVRHEPFRQFAIQAMTGTSGRQRVELSRLIQYPMALPPDASITQALEPTLRALQSRVAANDEQAKVLADLRDTLLPRLISGKLRVPEAQAQLEDSLS